MTQFAADGSPPVTRQLLVPAYFHPDVRPQDWTLLADRAAHIRLIVLNLASGPGTEPDAAFAPALGRLYSAGVEVVGYVDTNYGQRSAYVVLDEIGRYIDCRSSGVFDRDGRRTDSLRRTDVPARERERVWWHTTGRLPSRLCRRGSAGTFEGPGAPKDFTPAGWARLLAVLPLVAWSSGIPGDAFCCRPAPRIRGRHRPWRKTLIGRLWPADNQQFSLHNSMSSKGGKIKTAFPLQQNVAWPLVLACLQSGDRITIAVVIPRITSSNSGKIIARARLFSYFLPNPAGPGVWDNACRQNDDS